ncbi:MAG: ATP-binding cassette domain-containing protein [Bacteroidota bacterium]|nr:ATP-binding cassette domain-containing protein [Bacteroidota bacterium]
MEIVIKNLTKKYGLQKAVDDISFNLKRGEVLGFLGPNGAGKTTTMRIISCFLAPTSGDVLLNGKSIFENPESFKLKIGYLPENNPLYQDMFIIDYLKFIAEIQKVPKEKIPSRILEIIDYTGLGIERHKKIGELSKGYRQRVGLAQALIHDPEILILDEPTSGLDPNQIVEIRELIKNLGREKTILLSTHILQEVEATCDRIIIINEGQIVANSTTSELRAKMQSNELVTVQIGSDETIDNISKKLLEIESIPNLEVIDDKKNILQLNSKSLLESKKAIFDICVKNNWYLLGMKEGETKLEDIFKELTTKQNKS